MRPFIISALAATLIGCTGVAPKQTQQTSLMGYGVASALLDLKTKRAIAAKKSAHRHGRKDVSRTKNAKSNTVPNVASSVQPNDDKSNTLINGQSSVAAKTET